MMAELVVDLGRLMRRGRSGAPGATVVAAGVEGGVCILLWLLWLLGLLLYASAQVLTSTTTAPLSAKKKAARAAAVVVV
jgi:hypothetical protein